MSDWNNLKMPWSPLYEIRARDAVRGCRYGRTEPCRRRHRRFAAEHTPHPRQSCAGKETLRKCQSSATTTASNSHKRRSSRRRSIRCRNSCQGHNSPFRSHPFRSHRFHSRSVRNCRFRTVSAARTVAGQRVRGMDSNSVDLRLKSSPRRRARVRREPPDN